VLVTDTLKSYAAAKREILLGASTARTRASITWVENSNQPTRRRERIMKRFRSPRFLSTHDQLANLLSIGLVRRWSTTAVVQRSHPIMPIVPILENTTTGT
jgi:transposase-like protein